MADVEMKARIEQYVNFRAKFGIIQNSFPEVDQTVTADSENPVSSKAVYEFTKDIEEDLDTRIDGVSDELNRKIAEKPSRGEFKTVGGQSIFGEGDIPVGGGDGSVKDVTVNGASVLEEDGTAAITTSNMLGDGTISNRNVTEETNEVVMPLGDLDRLVKHAMGDGKGANWDETSKRNARSRLGVPSVSDLSAKQNKLTAGTNIKIEGDEISADGYDDTEIKEEIAALDDKIKELELFKYPNMTIIGEPAINHGQISGFSASSYLKFPFLVDFKNQSFVITMAFTTGPNVVNQENIFDSDFGLAFAVRNARFVIAISTNGTTWDLGEGVGSLVVQPNTNYFVRLAWDKSSYSLSYSFDGETYTTDIVKTGTVQPYPKQIFVGVGENFATVVNSFSGIVNLNSCNLAVNGEIIWTGMDDAGLSTRADVSLSNIDADGEAKIKEVAETTQLKADYTELNDRETISENNILNLDTRVRTLEQGGGEVGIDLVARNGVNKLNENLFINLDKPIAKADLDEYVDSVFSNGYYDGAGSFNETTGYKNWQINAKNSDYTIGFDNTSGYIQMSVFSGTPSSATHIGRYRTSDNNLPSISNPMNIPQGYVVVIATVTYTTTNFDVGLSFEQGVKFNNDRTNEIKAIAESVIGTSKKKFVKYINGNGENSSTERIEIYMPMVVGYLMYTFARCVVSADNCDVWRISSIKARNDDLTPRFDLSSNGEWECALRLKNRDDFAGGFMHGDERYANMTVFVDGIETSRYDLATIREFNELIITQKSSLFDPLDHTTVFADHGSKHTWKDGLNIEQMIIWNGNYEVDPSYLAMYPPLKIVTSKWYNNSEYYAKAITLPQTLHGCTSVTLYDTNIGFSSTFDVDKYPTISETEGYFYMSDNGGNPYNKCYYAVVGYGSSVSTNDIWRSSTNYHFEIVK